MAGVGRGRGRGRGLLCRPKSEPLPPGKPGAGGDAVSPKNGVGVNELRKLIENISLDAGEKDFKNIQDLAECFVKEENDLKTVAEIIYKKCLSDRGEFAKTGSIICEKLSTFEVNGAKFRSCILTLVQNDFKGREALRRNNPSQFLGFFQFLCQLFANMRTATGDPMKILVGAVHDCIELIIESEVLNEDQLDCLNMQLQIVGKELEANDRDRMNRLMETVRRKIIIESTGCSAQARCSLLELLECYARDWKQSSNDVTRFYIDTMADILAGMVV